MTIPKIPLQALAPVLVPVAAAAVGWYGIYQPQRARVLAAQANVVEEQRKTAMQRDIADREALLRAYQGRLPKTADMDWLINHTAQIAGQTGMQLNTVKPERPVEDKEKGCMRLTMTVETLATYHELGRFVGALESAEPFIRVDEVKVETATAATAETPAGRGASANRRQVILTLSTVYLP